MSMGSISTIKVIYNEIEKKSQNSNAILYECLSTLNKESQEMGINLISNENMKSKLTQDLVIGEGPVISESLIIALVSSKLTWNNILLLRNIINNIKIDDVNIIYIVQIINNLTNLIKKDPSSQKIAVMEILSIFACNRLVAMKNIVSNSKIPDYLFSQCKSSDPFVRVTAFNTFSCIIEGIHGSISQSLIDIVIKSIKLGISLNEKSLEVRAAAIRCTAKLIPLIIKKGQVVTNIQSILLKELTTSPSIGMAYGNLLSLMFIEAASSKDGKSLLKEAESLNSMLSHISSIFIKYILKREYKESLSECLITIFNNLSLSYLEQNFEVILQNFGEILLAHNLRESEDEKIQETLSSLSYIIRCSIFKKSSEVRKKSLLKMLISHSNSFIEQCGNIKKLESQCLKIIFLLSEIFYLLEESVLDLREDILNNLFQICSKYAVIQHNKTSNYTKTVWSIAGLVFRKLFLIEHNDFTYDKFLTFLPKPFGISNEAQNPTLSIWMYASSKINLQTNEFLKGFNLFKDMAKSKDKDIWELPSWLFLSSLINAYKPDQSSYNERIYEVLQVLWKIELSEIAPTKNFEYFFLKKYYVLSTINSYLVRNISESIIKSLLENVNIFTKIIQQCQTNAEIYNLNEFMMIMIPLLKFYHNIFLLDIPNLQQFIPTKQILQIIGYQILNTPSSELHLLYGKYVPPSDESLETKPQEFLGFSLPATSAYIPLYTSLFSFPSINHILLTSNSSTSSNLNLINEDYFPIVLHVLQELFNSFAYLFMYDEKNQLQVVDSFEKRLNLSSTDEKINLVNSNILMTFFVLLSNIHKSKHGNPTLYSISSHLKSNVLLKIYQSVKSFTYSPISLQRRISSYIIAYICDIDENVHIEIVKDLIKVVHNVKDDCTLMGSCFCFSILHKTLGGIRSRLYKKETFKVLCSALKQAYSHKHHELARYSLHSFFLSIESCGTLFHPYLKNIIELLNEMIANDYTKEKKLLNQIGQIVASVTQALGPEIQMNQFMMNNVLNILNILDLYGNYEMNYEVSFLYNSNFTERGVNWLVSGSFICCYESSSLIRERLILLAPQSNNFIKTRDSLMENALGMNADGYEETEYFLSPIYNMRLRALRSLNLLCQLNPQIFIESSIIEQILNCLDKEHPNSRLNSELKQILKGIEDSLIQSDPIKWVKTCIEYILDENKKKVENYPSTVIEKTDDPEESGMINIAQPQKIKVDSSTDEEQWVHGSTVLEFISSSIRNTLDYSKKKRIENIEIDLVKLLPNIVTLSYKAVNDLPSETKFSGISLMCTIIDHFSETADAEFEGHYILELYSAQLSASIRQCIQQDIYVPSKVLKVSYIALVKLILWISTHTNDEVVLKKLLKHLSENISFENEDQISLKEGRYLAYLISSSLLFEYGNKDLVDSFSEDPRIQKLLIEGWKQILTYWAMYQSTNEEKLNLFQDLTSVGIDWTDILLAACYISNQLDGDMVTLIIGLIMKNFTLGIYVKRCLIALNLFFQNLESNHDYNFLKEEKVIEELVKVLAYLYYNNKLVSVDEKVLVIEVLNSLLHFIDLENNEKDFIDRTIVFILLDSLELQINNDKLLRILNIISSSWMKLKTNVEENSLLMIKLFSIPLRFNNEVDASKIENACETLLDAIKKLQVQHDDEFLHSQICNLINQYYEYPETLKNINYNIIINTLSSLKNDTGDPVVLSKIIYIPFETMKIECFISLRLFIQHSFSTTTTIQYKLARSFLSVLTPKAIELLMSSVGTDNIHANVLIEAIKILILHKALVQSEEGLEKEIIFVLVYILKDVEETHPYSLVHETSLQLLLKMAQTDSNFKTYIDSLPIQQKEKFAASVRLSIQKQQRIEESMKSNKPMTLDFSRYS